MRTIFPWAIVAIVGLATQVAGRHFHNVIPEKWLPAVAIYSVWGTLGIFLFLAARARVFQGMNRVGFFLAIAGTLLVQANQVHTWKGDVSYETISALTAHSFTADHVGASVAKWSLPDGSHEEVQLPAGGYMGWTGLIALFDALCGNSPDSVFITNAILTAALFCLLWIAGTRVCGNWGGFVAALAAAGLPVLSVASTGAGEEIAKCCVLISLGLILFEVRQNPNPKIVGAALAASALLSELGPGSAAIFPILLVTTMWAAGSLMQPRRTYVFIPLLLFPTEVALKANETTISFGALGSDLKSDLRFLFSLTDQFPNSAIVAAVLCLCAVVGLKYLRNAPRGTDVLLGATFLCVVIEWVSNSAKGAGPWSLETNWTKPLSLHVCLILCALPMFGQLLRAGLGTAATIAAICVAQACFINNPFSPPRAYLSETAQLMTAYEGIVATDPGRTLWIARSTSIPRLHALDAVTPGHAFGLSSVILFLLERHVYNHVIAVDSMSRGTAEGKWHETGSDELPVSFHFNKEEIIPVNGTRALRLRHIDTIGPDK